jgi:phosphopantothenate---cysteine ligase (CTP)
MKCVVTAGGTWEPLDQVRRLTNFSTGRLGIELAGHLTDQGHEVVLLLAETATYSGKRRAREVRLFTTTASLREALSALAGEPVGAVFHAAAVSDFRFGRVWVPDAQGELKECREDAKRGSASSPAEKPGKLSTRQGTLLAELVPTEKLISQLRAWFPKSMLVGWKYEVEGSRVDVLSAARMQLAGCLTDSCVVNGPAYGAGFGFVTADGTAVHLPDRESLFRQLEQKLVD